MLELTELQQCGIGCTVLSVIFACFMGIDIIRGDDPRLMHVLAIVFGVFATVIGILT